MRPWNVFLLALMGDRLLYTQLCVQRPLTRGNLLLSNRMRFRHFCNVILQNI